MKGQIIAQIIVALLFIGGMAQTIVFTKQGKKNWWLGIIICIIMGVGSFLIWKH